MKKLVAILAASVMTFSTMSFIPVKSDSANNCITVSAAASKISISNCTVKLSATSYIYNGSPKKPTVTVKNGKTTLKSGKDYTISYSNNKNVGTAYVKITGKGSYKGTKKVSFKINAIGVPTGIKATSPNNSSIKISWTKLPYASGYILQKYNTSTKSYDILTKTSSTSHTNKNLKAGTTCKYRICAYRKIGSNTYKTYSKAVSCSVLTTEKYYQNQVLSLVNEERTSRGLSPLKANNVLNSIATKRASQIKLSFAHTYKGINAGDMLDDAGYMWYSWGENIAAGQSTPEIVVDAWMNSEGHRKNILSTKFNRLGVGYSNKYWVQIFTD